MTFTEHSNKNPVDSLSLKDKEEIMRGSFRRQAKEVLQNLDQFIKTGEEVIVGLEFEASVMNGNFHPFPENLRNDVVAEDNEFFDCELGAAQIEWRTPPIDIRDINTSGFLDLARDITTKLERAAEKQQGWILRLGSNPFVPIGKIERTNKTKYQQVPDFHNQRRDHELNTFIGRDEKVDVGDAAVVSLLNSIQCNIEANNAENAIEMLNRSFAIGPMAVALSGNACFLEGIDTGLNDLRMIAWNTSHDIRSATERDKGILTRIGLPREYFRDLNDYFNRITEHPFILFSPEHALSIGIGLNWNDARIKVIGSSLVVEFRPVSIQPTTYEDIAVMLFYVGRLFWSIKTNEPLLPLNLVAKNREGAMAFGINTWLNTQIDRRTLSLPAKDALLIELIRAEQALKDLGINPYMFNVLKERIRTGRTPSDILSSNVRRISERDKVPTVEALKSLFQPGGEF